MTSFNACNNIKSHFWKIYHLRFGTKVLPMLVSCAAKAFEPIRNRPIAKFPWSNVCYIWKARSCIYIHYMCIFTYLPSYKERMGLQQHLENKKAIKHSKSHFRKTIKKVRRISWSGLEKQTSKCEAIFH